MSLKRDRLSIEPSELYNWDREQEQDDDDAMSTTSSHVGESRVSKKLKLPNKGSLSTKKNIKAKTPTTAVASSASSSTSGAKRKKTPTNDHNVNPYMDEPVLNKLSLRDRSVEMHDTHHHPQAGIDAAVIEPRIKQLKTASKSKPSTAIKKKKASTPAPVQAKNSRREEDNDSEDEVINVISLRDRNVEVHSIHHLHSHTGSHPSPFVEDIDLLDEMVLIRNPSKKAWGVGGWKISDNESKNSFTFPADTVVPAQGVLHVYCCSKGRDYKKAKRPYIYWTNKDGTPRMKNVLNDDGDKIILWDNHDVLVSTCEKMHPAKVPHGHIGRMSSSNHIVINTGPAHGDSSVITATSSTQARSSTEKPKNKAVGSSSSSLSVAKVAIASSAPKSTFKQPSPKMATSLTSASSSSSSSSVSSGSKGLTSRTFGAENSSHIPFNSPTRYAIGSNSSVIESCFMQKNKTPVVLATPEKDIEEEEEKDQTFLAFLALLFSDLYGHLLQLLALIGLMPLKKERLGILLFLLLLYLMFLCYDRLLLLLTPGIRVVQINPLAVLREKVNALENGLNDAMDSFKSTQQSWIELRVNGTATNRKAKIMELRAIVNSLIEDAAKQKGYLHSVHNGESLRDTLDFERLADQVSDFNTHFDGTATDIDGILKKISLDIQEEERLQVSLSRGPSSDVLRARERGTKALVKEMMESYILETKEAKCSDCDANRLASKTNYAALYRGARVLKDYSYGHKEDAILPITSPMLNPVEWYRHASGFQGYETTDSNIVLGKALPKDVGECFAFAGSNGYVTIDLSQSIIPLSLQMYHFVPPIEFHTYNFSKNIAPRDFSVYGWNSVVEGESMHLGNFQYTTYPTHEDHSSKLLQSFELKHSTLTNRQRLAGIKKVTVYIKNNGGDDVFTCLYRLKVFGTSISTTMSPLS